jgi:CubicO group peptidase (beta-lactamase class C family)
MRYPSRLIVFGLFICFLFLLSANVSQPEFAPTLLENTSPPVDDTPPLKTEQSNEAIITDLDTFILTQMRTSSVPGLSVALIRGNKLVWEKGYGVINILTRQPVTPETVFDVASNGKAIAAYAALNMVSKDQLALDTPMVNYFEEPWLPPLPYGNQVSLRHILSHTSGLSNNTSGRDREIAFQPGDDFSYSGAGFRYLQETIEQVTGDSINPTIQKMILSPLGMSSSSYVYRDDQQNQTSTGHFSAIYMIGIFSIPFMTIFLSFILIASILNRLRTGKWVLPIIILIGLGFVAAASPAIIARAVFSYYTARFIRTASLYGIVFWVVILITYQLVSRITAKIPDREPRGKFSRKHIGTTLSMLLVISLLVGVTMNTPAPLRPRSYSRGNIAFTFRSTAGDLARFLIEISDPQVMQPELAALIQEPQIKINEHNSWGLGMGIQHSPVGDSLWHWGASTGYRSIMIIYPQHDIGIVVLTNSNDGLKFARDISQFALGGLNEWDITPD